MQIPSHDYDYSAPPEVRRIDLADEGEMIGRRLQAAVDRLRAGGMPIVAAADVARSAGWLCREIAELDLQIKRQAERGRALRSSPGTA